MPHLTVIPVSDDMLSTAGYAAPHRADRDRRARGPSKSIRFCRLAGKTPWSECGIRELKATARLAARPPARRLAALGRAAAQLNRRPRLSNNHLTVLELWRSMFPATTLVDRETSYRAAGAAMTAAVTPQAKSRARRRAERAAIFATLEQFDRILRYRGGARINPRVAETIT